jgi:hypothetical protein
MDSESGGGGEYVAALRRNRDLYAYGGAPLSGPAATSSDLLEDDQAWSVALLTVLMTVQMKASHAPGGTGMIGYF